jgi:2'-5' RNA ligase
MLNYLANKISNDKFSVMKQMIGPLLPGYQVYEYLLVLSPHEDLRNRIRAVRKDFFDSYGAGPANRGKPHIPLAGFVQYGLKEERIIHHLKILSMGLPPIKVELRDYGSFPSHTIFIQVTSKLPVQHLIKTIRSDMQGLMKLNDDHKPHFILEPHINIATRLKPWQYEKSWLEYSHKHFTGRFIAEAMLLLKRRAGELNYQIAQRFEFQNLPVGIKQGELFGQDFNGRSC